MDLNGLDWNLSLQIDFIEIPEINHHPPNLRQLTSNNVRKRELEEEEKRLRQSGKKKELEQFSRIKERSKFINN